MKKFLIVLAFISFFADVFPGNVDTVYIHSRSMDKEVPNIVITPDEYSKVKEGYPVLYLLHGAGNDFTEWMGYIPDLPAYADIYSMLIVCPDAGRTSWYFDSPVDTSMKYETYVVKELVGWIDEHYKTIRDRNKRAIVGLSMGGHGALYLAFRHQDLWGAAGSIAGGVDFRPFPNNWDLAKRLGSYAEYPDNWEKNTVINMLHLLDGRQLKILFDCGVDDIFYDPNRRLHQEMLMRNIPHEYLSRPGKHDLDYWKVAIKYQLFFVHDFFNYQ
jgi:S-formylglutathione hydrolase FrmB